MKINALLFFVLGLFIFSSCGDDPSPEELIVGSWDLSSFVTTGCDDVDNNDNFVFGDASCEDDGNGDIYCLTATAVFTAPSSVILSQFQTLNGVENDSFIQTGTYSFAENGEMTICFDGECDPGVLTVSETSMLWVGNADADGCTTTVTGSK